MYVYEQVAQFVSEHPNGVGRLQVRSAFKFAPTTAVYHLEKACDRGLIRKVWTWVTKSSRGWVYYPLSEHSDYDGLTPEQAEEWKNG